MSGNNKSEELGLTERIKKLIPKKGFARSVLVLASGTAMGQVLLVAASPFLTRFYNPDEFGILAIYVSVLSLLVVIASWRYQMAIPLPEEDGVAANILVLSLLIVVLMVILTSLAICVMGDTLVRLLGLSSLRQYLWLLPVSLLGAGLYQALNYWAIRKKEYGHISRTKLSQSAGQVGTQLLLGWMNNGPLGLLLGDAVGRIGGSGTLAALAWLHDKAALKEVSISRIRWAAYRYRRFPLLSTGSALLNTIGLQISPILLAIFYGPQVAGWFALGQRVLGAPLNLLGASVAQVYLAESARIANMSGGELYKLFVKTLKNMFLIGLPFVIFLALTSPWLFKFVFGHQWIEAGVYLQALALMYFLQFVSGSIGGTLDVLERQDLHLIREVIRTFMMTAAVIFAGMLHAKPIIAIILLSVAGSISYGVAIYLAWFAVRSGRCIL